MKIAFMKTGPIYIFSNLSLGFWMTHNHDKQIYEDKYTL